MGLGEGPITRNAHWAESSALFAHRARHTKNEYLVLALGEKTADQAVVGSIVWAFRRLKKPRCREMSSSGYALHSVYPQPSFLYLCFLFEYTIDSEIIVEGIPFIYEITHKSRK